MPPQKNCVTMPATAAVRYCSPIENRSLKKGCGFLYIKGDKPMQKAITELIPSESLKKAIYEQGFILSELSLTEIAYIAAPDFDSRIKYLKMLEKALSTEYGRYAGKLAEYEHKKLEIIKNGGDDIIYELNIKTAPNACTERFFCRDLDSALKLIPKYYKEYEDFCTETELSRYTGVLLFLK